MKTLKIIGWTLLGIVLTIIAVACIAMYVIFTPERLTPVARQAADKFIACQYEIGEVDLTFFSTFPRFGLRADGLLLVNPKTGAQNDTVVEAKHLIATVDVMEFLTRKNLHVHEAILDDATVNFYIAPDGTTNLTGAFITSPDTVEEVDTTAFSLPFDEIRVDGLRLYARSISFVDDKDTITASLGATELKAHADNWEDVNLTLEANDICAALKGETYADSLQLTLKAPMVVDLDAMHFALKKAYLSLNEFGLTLDGTADIQDSIGLDMTLTTDRWGVAELLELVPAQFTSSLKDIDVDGEIALTAHAQGWLSDTRKPRVTAHLTLTDAEGRYKPLPYTLKNLALDADALLNLNEGQLSEVTIHKLTAKTKQSQIAAKGHIDDLLGDMLLDLQLNLDANIPDFDYFLPDSMELDGRAKGTADMKIRLDDLTAMKLEKGRITADLDLTDIHYAQGGMDAVLPKTHAVAHIPNTKPSKRSLNWASIDLTTDKIDFVMDTTVKAALGASTIRLEAANVLAKGQDYGLALQTQALNAIYEDIHAALNQAHLDAFVSGGKTLSAKISTAALDARIGNELKAQTGALALEASARYNSEGENALLKWNPRLKINLKQGELAMPERLPEIVRIPSIDFKYSNREMNINNARVELGRSDLNLRGNVRNIGKWFRHEDVLQGELEVVSNHCDANQLMAWFSADKGSEEESPTAESGPTDDAGQKDPFLVPTDVDLALKTHMQEVEIFNQEAKDLKGGLYIKDGTVILDEMGFVCRAAKLQLTAMYRTPRRNHLYVGLDYHMIDVDIDELLSMIPEIEEMVPMLSSFKGAAQFHLAAETYMNSQYKPKMSTLRGAASLTAKDLVVLDGETFDQIAKMLMFKKKTENKIDSINAEMTIYKNEIDVYPLCVQMDNYMVALGGRHNTDMTFNYDINVLSPIYLGLNVSGNIDDLKYKLVKCKFAQDFKPHWYQKADNQSRELRERIKKSMEKNVRIQ